MVKQVATSTTLYKFGWTRVYVSSLMGQVDQAKGNNLKQIKWIKQIEQDESNPKCNQMLKEPSNQATKKT